eukprot:snap_masked-scaffold1277_size51002-processed-gene-0.0 protein:Tk01472 transcript:snap_masked-scaffold1277_size51002-processed-gene-0.0-mRNA-1 annotation:"hypothetical protein BV95_01080"
MQAQPDRRECFKVSYEPRLEDESRFIVCQAQQQNVEDPWTTRRAIEVKDIQFGPIFLEIQGRSHLQCMNARIQLAKGGSFTAPCPVTDTLCFIPNSIRETKLEIELKFQVVDPQILELDLSLAPSPQLENGSRKYYQLQVQHPQGDTTKIITFSNEVNEMRFHWLWLLLIVVVASVIVFASAVCMVNHWRSKRRNPTETADEESSGTSVCPSYDVPYEFTNGSEHYYERIKNEGESGCLVILKEFFLQSIPLVSRRYNFFECNQHAGEPFSDWYLRLQFDGNEAELESLTVDDIYALRIITGTSDLKLRE